MGLQVWLDRRGWGPQNGTDFDFGSRGNDGRISAVGAGGFCRVVPVSGVKLRRWARGSCNFGARRPLREMALPVLALMGTEYYLTVFAYHYPFHTSAYLITWRVRAVVVRVGFC